MFLLETRGRSPWRLQEKHNRSGKTWFESEANWNTTQESAWPWRCVLPLAAEHALLKSGYFGGRSRKYGVGQEPFTFSLRLFNVA